LERTAHRLVGNAGVLVNLAFGAEAVRAVESQGVNLGGKQHLPVAAPRRGFDELRQDRAAHAAAAKLPEHRHPADVAVRQQATGTDRSTALEGERMDALGIVPVELDLDGHALLLDEHRVADAACRRARLLPAHQLDLQPRAKRSIAARKAYGTTRR